MLKSDLHIHTIASGHAHNTILEYINRAKELKMKMIGISDHGPSCPDVSINNTYFRTLERLPDKIDGVRILKGIEANIINKKGDLDIPDELIDRLDYIMAGLHRTESVKDRGIVVNTKSVVNAIKLGRIDIITHPFFTKEFPLNTERISEAACQHNVLLEVNISCLKGRKLQKDTLPNLRKMVSIAKKNKQKIIIGSDAHNIWELADSKPWRAIKT